MSSLTLAVPTVPVTISSREIAELTGKQHQHIKRDIESMLADLEKDASSFGRIYQDSMSRPQTEYALPRRECLILVSGYDVVMRAKIIDRWLVLEAQTALPTVPTLPILESSLVLDFQGVPIRLLIDESGSWMAAYRDVATALGYINKEQQWSARNMLLYTAKSADRQLRHPLYGDLIALTGIDRIVASLQRNAASDPDRASRAGSFRAWLATVAYPLVANPASAGLLLSQRWTPPAALALERDPDYEQTARVLKLWHQDLGESAYRAADVLVSATADFASALAEAASGRWFSAVLSAKRLGKWLAARQGQTVDGLKIECAVERNQKIKLWAVSEAA